MTLYGDLDLSVIDELPSGRKPIITLHRNDSYRLKVFGFLKDQIDKGRQVYIIYPLIEESDHFNLKDLMDGYESIARAFPGYPLSIVHGRMRADDKEYEMQRFAKNETKIMVATTVIEVGINVPNASVMVIENAEKFGLSQLHQLRGRVGRGADQSYCILMTEHKISTEARKRIEVMVRTNNGFEIAEVDLELRGAGDLAGTQQSGTINLKIADLIQDQAILLLAREEASQLVENDPGFSLPGHQPIKKYLQEVSKDMLVWTHIS
jgi:ATP-dependent DNA helicase RecG